MKEIIKARVRTEEEAEAGGIGRCVEVICPVCKEHTYKYYEVTNKVTGGTLNCSKCRAYLIWEDE